MLKSDHIFKMYLFINKAEFKSELKKKQKNPSNLLYFKSNY